MNRRKFVIGAGSIVGGTAAAAAFTGTGAAAHAESSYVGSTSLESDTGEIDYVAMYGDSTMEWKGLDTPARYAQIRVNAEVYDSSDERVNINNVPDNEVLLHETDLFSLDNNDWGGDNEELSGTGTRGYIKSAIGLSGSGEDAERDEETEWVIVGEKPSEVPGSDYGLPNKNSVPADALTVDEDGEEETFYVIVKTKYILYGSNDEDDQLIEAESAGNINVTVENIEEGTKTGDGPAEDGATGNASNDGETLGY